jgi:hypothetical protein
MFSRHLRVALCGAVATFTSVGPTLSHEIVGNRFFPATLTIDDPGVNDELAFRPLPSLRPAMIHRSNNLMSQPNLPSASQMTSPSLWGRLGRGFTRRVGRP